MAALITGLLIFGLIWSNVNVSSVSAEEDFNSEQIPFHGYIFQFEVVSKFDTFVAVGGTTTQLSGGCTHCQI